MATTKKSATPLCPKIDAEGRLELKSIQCAIAQTINAINTAKEQVGQLDQAFRNKVDAIVKQLGVDVERVEFNAQELKFQLKPGRKGNR